VDTSRICGFRLCRALGLGAIVALLLLAAMPAQLHGLGEWIDLDPESGHDGENVRVSGEDFSPSYQKRSGDWVNVYVRLYFSSDQARIGDSIDVEVEDYEIVDKSEKVDKHGGWKVSFTVPSWLTDGEDEQDVEGGTYYVYVTYKGDNEIVAAEEFDVRAIDLRWSPWWRWSPCGPSWHWYYPPCHGQYYYYDDWYGCPPCPCAYPDDWDDYPCPPFLFPPVTDRDCCPDCH
jgi:hypothetical protein